MLTDTIANLWLEPERDVEPSIEIMRFDIGEVSFGIPITKINRVIYNGNLGEDFSLTQNVDIIDLHQRILGISVANPNAIAIFMDDSQKLAGIPLDTAPVLSAIPIDRLRILPIDFRASSPLGIASHIAIVTIDNTESTIFILG